LGYPRRPDELAIGLRQYFWRGFLLFIAIFFGLLADQGAALAFEEIPFIAPVTKSPPKGTPVNVDAAVITYDKRSLIATATGKVVMHYGPYTLTATHATYNTKTGEFKANGSVELREPNGNILQAETMAMRDAFKNGFATHVRALLTNDVLIAADYAKRDDGNTTVYTKFVYTACTTCVTRHGNPVWELDADTTYHDEKNHILYHVKPRLKVDGVTIAALPYLEMPDPTVTRRSGFLAPEFRITPMMGFGLATPYFWAISPSADLTLRPIWSTRQIAVADLEYRQALENGAYNFNAYGVRQISKDAPPDDQDWRGAIDTHGKFDVAPGWTAGWNGTFASDNMFLNHYGFDYRRIAQNNIYATGLNDQTYISAQLLNWQSLDTSINQDDLPYAMPFITGEHISRNALLGGDLKYEWNAYSLTRPVNSSPFTEVNHGTAQTRATSQVTWQDEWISSGGVVASPFATLRGDAYIADNLPDPSLPTQKNVALTGDVLPAAGLDVRMPMVANYRSGQSVISPVAQIIVAANEPDPSNLGNEDSISLNFDHTNLFLADKFNGFDRYDGGTKANLGVTYAFYGSGGNYLRASAGESVHIAGENSFTTGSGLDGPISDLVSAVQVQPWDHLMLSYELRTAEDFSSVHQQEILASLDFDSFTADVDYLSIPAEPAYGRLSAENWVGGNVRYKLNDGWSVYGGLTYDLVSNQIAKRSLGVEFDCECMNFKLEYSGTVDTVTNVQDDRLSLSVAFRTLGKTTGSYQF
jgi:LPS-assembly protein